MNNPLKILNESLLKEKVQKYILCAHIVILQLLSSCSNFVHRLDRLADRNYASLHIHVLSSW